MHKTYVNALVMDKGNLGIDSLVRDSLTTFYQRNLYIDGVLNNPIRSIMEDAEDTCLHKASEMNFDYLILTWEGNIFDIHNYHRECVKYIDSLGDEWLVAGHIMDQKQNRILYNDPLANEWTNSYWLFPITAVVNIKQWEKLGKPRWGKDDGYQFLRNILPSKECVHDNYTPLKIIPTEGFTKTNTKKGWNIIEVSMTNNLPVYNLNDGIRSSQKYLYPENDVDKYNKFWTALYTMPKLTDQYKSVLETILPSKFPRRIHNQTWQCFIKNTENYFSWEPENGNKIDLSNIDTIALPSSGFKDFIVSMSKHSPRKEINVLHFDIIKECIDIRRKIIERWDGRRETFEEVLIKIGGEYRPDPMHTYHMHSMKNIIEAYDHILKYFEDEEDLKNCWQRFKNFNHQYIEADMLDNPLPAIKLINSKNLYICLSDIAGWRNNIIGYGYQNLRNDIKHCIEKINRKGIIGYVDYKDPKTDLQMWQTFTEAIEYLK